MLAVGVGWVVLRLLLARTSARRSTALGSGSLRVYVQGGPKRPKVVGIEQFGE
jgi:hypothetical protein